MNTNRGFTLTEVLIASGILACGLVAVASVFSFVIRANSNNRQMTVATTLLYDKMEDFRSLPLTDPIWTNPGGSETLVVMGETYLRSWQIGTATPRTVTLIVHARNNALTGRQAELLRATTTVSPSF